MELRSKVGAEQDKRIKMSNWCKNDLSLESGKPWKLVAQIVKSGSPDFPVFEYFYLFDIRWITVEQHRTEIKFGEHICDVIEGRKFLVY